MASQYSSRQEILQRREWAGSWHALIVAGAMEPDSMPDALMVIKASQLLEAWKEYQERCEQIEKLIQKSADQNIPSV